MTQDLIYCVTVIHVGTMIKRQRSPAASSLMKLSFLVQIAPQITYRVNLFPLDY
jgi:hypothetical protein